VGVCCETPRTLGFFALTVYFSLAVFSLCDKIIALIESGSGAGAGGGIGSNKTMADIYNMSGL
jgi:hypothetical protein